jgi:putative transposase
VVFFSFIIDAFSRRIVGWQFAPSMRTELVLDALRVALTWRDAGSDVQLIHHSDAGSQYTSFAFQQVLEPPRPRQHRLGWRCHDNAMAESFVDTFKTEVEVRGGVVRTPAMVICLCLASSQVGR